MAPAGQRHGTLHGRHCRRCCCRLRRHRQVVALATVRTSAVSNAAMPPPPRHTHAVRAAAVLTLRLPVCRSRARWGASPPSCDPLLAARRRAAR